MTAAQAWRLLVDVGGTNVRFGRSGGDGAVRDSRTWPAPNFDCFETALAAYRDELGDAANCSAVMIAGAGPVSGNRIDLTNSSWNITRVAVVDTLGRDLPVRLFNDLEAVALGLPYLQERDVHWISRPDDPAGNTCGRLLAVNVGTGFGSAVAIKTRDAWVTCPAESGHIPLGAQSSRELAILRALDLERDPTWEDVLSGNGLRELYRAVAHEQQAAPAPVSAPASEEIFACVGNDPLARETLQLFTQLMSRASASMVLAGAVWDGVFLCGSVATAWAGCADLDAFRRGFTVAGKMQGKLAAVPVGVLTLDLPAFVGLANVPIDD